LYNKKLQLHVNPVDPSSGGQNALLPGDILFLSNLTIDVSESINLANQFPEKVNELKKLFLD